MTIESDATYKALDQAIRNHIQAMEPGAVVVEWIAPTVAILPGDHAGQSTHFSITSELPLHNRLGLLVYHLHATKALIGVEEE